MKHYLDLVLFYRRAHKKQNRMSVFCIFLSVFLVAVIFGMADMYVRSMLLKTKREDGNWHIMLSKISDEEAALIAARPEVRAFTCYGVLNYGLDQGYTAAGKDVVFCGSEETLLTEIYADSITEGTFPRTDDEVLVTANMKKEAELVIGSQMTIRGKDGAEYPYTVSGFAEDPAMILSKDACGVFMTTAAFREFFPGVTDGEPDDYDSCFLVQFYDHANIRSTINDIKAQFSLTDEQVGEQAMLLSLLGQSDEGNLFMMGIYSVAAGLSVLVLLSGILMIAGSLNSNIAGRTEFFGMLRCVGATPKQILRLVRREAFSLCAAAIPASILSGMVIIWILCAVLRALSPKYFFDMPVFAVSLPSVAAGVIIGILTVFLASRAPAKRAAQVSPLAAVSGSANRLAPVRRAANTRFCKVETALGIHHARESRRNFLLVVSSFALSIILFLSFSTTVDFMKHAIKPLSPWSPDLSIISPDNSCTIDRSLAETLQELPAVKRVYGRMFAYDLPATAAGKTNTAVLISYEEHQFEWAEKYLLDGSLKEVQERTGCAMIVSAPQYNNQSAIQTGDTVTLSIDGRPASLTIAASVSECPFNTPEGDIIICSENTFRELIGTDDYTIIDLQLTAKATESDVEQIRALAGDGVTFSDMRSDKQSVLGAVYSFRLFLYGFLFLIALVTVCNIVNCVAMSVEARKKQYGGLRAIGLSGRQLTKMIIAETAAYAITGSVFGMALGLFLNKKMFEILVTRRWGESWSLPGTELAVIAGIMVFSVILAIRTPTKKLREMSITETLHAQ
ncbi:MAG: FtsX-like permease family protein [Bacteroidales bacterium]|nr:FtsX-like permease family protein [Bacteroidales bacterium]MCM1415385.1 FtsX-like permease family protein [bacterium]MCM1423318.1 FtsX-like permease family protein [bacterium]